MILPTAIVLLLCYKCSSIGAELDCTNRDHRDDIFVDGNAVLACVSVGNGRFVSHVKKCIINDTSDIEFDYIEYSYLKQLFRKDRQLSKLPLAEQCNYLINNPPRKMSKSQIKHGSFVTILSERRKPKSTVKRKLGDKETDIGEYVGVALNDTTNVADLDCKAGNLAYRITLIESGSWIECDIFKGVKTPKLKKCLLKKLSPFTYESIELDDLNFLKRQEAFRNTGAKYAVDFCNSLQSDYEKVIGVIGKNRVKEVSIDNLTNSQDGSQVYDITVHDNGRVYYFKETTKQSDVRLNCDDSDRNNVLIVRRAVTECQKTESGQMKQALTKCIYREDADRFQYFTAEGVDMLRTSAKFQYMAHEDMFTFCNRLRNIEFEYIVRSLVLPDKYVQNTIFDDLVKDKLVTWFRDPNDMWG